MVLVPLALTGVLGLAGVVLVHELAEVVIIANGVRAARHRPIAESVPPLEQPAPLPAISLRERARAGVTERSGEEAIAEGLPDRANVE